MNEQTKTKPVKLKDLPMLWNALHATVPVNENPFKAIGQRILFKIQPDIKYISELSEEDFEAIQDQTIQVMEAPIPEYYPQEYRSVLSQITARPIAEPASQAESILKRIRKAQKKEDPRGEEIREIPKQVPTEGVN